MTQSLELLHVTIELPHTIPINIIRVYRSPSSNIGEFIILLSNFLSSIEYTCLPIIILGDFNIDVSIINPN